MKSLFLLLSLVPLFTFMGCKENPPEKPDDPTSEEAVLSDFAHILANPNYQDIESRANTLNASILDLNADATDAKLKTAQDNWRNLRQAWEQCEGFLFGPVEDFNYDPMMDDWPVNHVDLDSLLASSNSLTPADVEALPTSLKGFHPMEYMLFGVDGRKKAADMTAREKEYLASLSENLYKTTTALRASWDVSEPGNFTNQLINAGNGSTYFESRKEAFIAIVTAMAGICDEVANGKMEEPLAAQDSSLEESQFSHNSTEDFRNNMIGVRNAYLAAYSTDGHGLNELVNAKNLSLDNKLNQQIEAAISSFDNIDANYGAAIYNQKVQIKQAQDAINELKSTIENDLMEFVQLNLGK